MIKWLPLLVLSVALLGCEKPVVEVQMGQEHEEAAPMLTEQEVLAKLPCFQCHSVKNFFMEPRTGYFSHVFHQDFGIHCNQCHDVKGHGMPRIALSTCSGCHSMASFTYSGGGMGKVTFNHEFHGMSFGCRECHPDEFLMKKGATPMKMDAMYQGKLCGACHNGQMAFATTDCAKCHKGS
jgi:c(7)-type cytochrome triheme protein